MPDGTTILKNPALTPDQDYALLRAKGLQYIEELGSRLWTDYNEHDPGITIMEALCYAITELGYRAGLPMQDLLVDANATIPSSQPLFTAKNILTQSPLTIDDYRKLLVDINGIHNAWMFTDDFYMENGKAIPAGEVAVYADCANDALSYKISPHPVYIHGLYKVLLDLDNDLQFGDLNNGDIIILSPAAGLFRAGDVSFTVSLPAWNEADADLTGAKPASIAVATAPTVTINGNNWKMSADVSFNVGNNSFTKTINGAIAVDLQPAGHTITLADVEQFFTAQFTQQVFNLYVLKIQKAKGIVETARRVLDENRNLCEDFVGITTVKDEEIAICCDIDVAPGADMEEVQAEVFYAIEEYLNPTIKFYLLKELLDKGYTVDEVFEGPKLEHGFVDTAELEKTQLRQEIYTSDIINLVMDVKGVLAVKNFRMTKYDVNGNPVPGSTGKGWCMPVTLWHKPVFSETKSKIVFYKNQFPYLPSLAEVRDTLRWLQAIHMRNKLTGHADDIALPNGNFQPLDEYTSIEYLFPQTYGIGKAGLPTAASQERKAQARQLKAYLLFYDQLLADFLMQLKNARQLFSTDNIVQTYYAHFLDDIKDIDPIYKKNGSSQNLLQLVLQSQDSTAAPPNDWQKLYEDNEMFLDRRNRFLDHLMSRFAESFNDYVLLMYSLDYETQQETKIDPADIINNKITFLKSYPSVSYDGAAAFNYFPQKYSQSQKKYVIDKAKLWNTDNVSGLEKKACFLSGIGDFTRRFLYCMGKAKIITTADTPAKFKFVFKDSQDNTLTSVASYDTQAQATEAVPALISLAMEGGNYRIKQTGAVWQLSVIDHDGNAVAMSNDFDTKENANNSFRRFTNEFKKQCDSTGLHLVEHVLLRPRNNQFALAPVCLDPDCDFCGEEDPYSFRMSVVLPYWPVHFNNLAFRSYFEDIIRREAPAHTTVKVCWINNEAMYEFETAYKAWIIALADYSLDATTVNALQAANDKLLGLLFTLHSEYPVAALHDCEESKDTNPVMLGKTILGSIKN